MKKLMKGIAFLPMVIMMCVIWGFSANTGEISSGQSQGIVTMLIEQTEHITGITLTEEEQMIWENRIHTPIRKIAHMTEYMIFALTVAVPLVLYLKKRKMISVITFGYCVLYAALDEIHQLFVPERSGQVRDVMIDAIGILLGILIFRGVAQKREKTGGTL